MSSTLPSTHVNPSPTRPFSVSTAASLGDSTSTEEFVDRRSNPKTKGRSERRQFGSSHEGLSEDGRELAMAIDQYKLQRHRRYITCDEMLIVLRQLGYEKQ